MTTTSAKPTSEANPPNKRGADYLSQRPFLSCGEIGTNWGFQTPKQSLFHRNFIGACDDDRPKLAPLHQAKVPFRNVSERDLGGWGLLGFVR